MSANIGVTRLTSSVGARIEGVDLGRDIDEEVRRRLEQDYPPHERKVFRVTAGSVAPVSPMRMPTGV